MAQFFHLILYQPLFNLLVFLYNVIPGQDVGVAIIALTLLTKLLLYPLTRKSLKAQRDIQLLQPKLKEIQEKHKNDKTLQAQETMKLYKEHGVNPLGGCLPLLIQLPLLIALFQVFHTGFEPGTLETDLYSFVANPGTLNPWFLGIVDLSKRSIILALLAGVAQFSHTRLMGANQMMQKSKEGGSDMGQMMQKQMMFMMPILTVVISFSLPAALPFYWFVNTLFSIGEHHLSLPRSLTGFHVGEEKKSP